MEANEHEHGGILTDEQAEAIRNKHLTPAQRHAKEKRDAEAKRKRDERAREKDAKEMAEIATIEQLWGRNRKLFSENELNDLRAKDERVHDLWNWIELALEGSDISRDPAWPTLEAGVAAVEAHVAEFGLCNPEILLLGQFWKSQSFYETLKARTDSTGVFALTGFFVALPELRVIQLRQHVGKVKL
jgi:hypothetical protein